MQLQTSLCHTSSIHVAPRVSAATAGRPRRLHTVVGGAQRGAAGSSAAPSEQQQPLQPAQPSTQQQRQQQVPLVRRLLQSAGHLAVAAAVLLSSPAAVADEEGATILRLPASENPDIYAAQQTLMETWSLVGDSFVDESFNGHWWPEELKRHMLAAYSAGSGAAAYGEIEAMLSELGDPYTRIIPPSEYADFRVSSDGELQGVGLLIANEPVNNHLLVLSAIRGSPADRAGMAPGDEVIAINDQPTDGWTGDMAAKLLRGKGGTEVRLKFARRTAGIPGVAGRPEPRSLAGLTGAISSSSGSGVLPYYEDDSATVREVRLRREKVALSPVYFTALQVDSGRGSRSSAAAASAVRGFSVAPAPPLSAGDEASASMAAPYGGVLDSYSSTAPGRRPFNNLAAAAAAMARGPTASAAEAPPAQRQPPAAAAAAADERWGYLRLTSFSQNAAEETRRAIISLDRKGVAGYILDLRDNPGGLVRAGIDIARLLLDGHPTVFSIVSRGGEPEQKVVLGGEDPFSDGPSEALTRKPLVVLVNNHSASASEILSGALHDNGRATIIGDTPTYGKGRIQSVYELRDGSALFVTVAKYVTPAGTPIDLKGLRPDTSCALSRGGSGPDASEVMGPDARGLLAMAASFVPGMPVGAGAEEALVSALNEDGCVLKAASVLHDKLQLLPPSAQAALPRSQ